MSLPAVPGLLGAASYPGLLASQPDAQVWVLVRRQSLGRFERLALAWGERAKPLVGDLTRARAQRRNPRRTGPGRPSGALRGDLRHHRRRGGAARRQCRGHPGRHRAGRTAGRHAAPRVVDRGGGRFPRRVHRGRLRRRPATADPVSPDQVRGRTAGARHARTAVPDLPARRWWSAIRAPARWTRSTARTTSSGCWPSWRYCPRSRRCCCPTPAAPTSSRSTMWPTRSSP